MPLKARSIGSQASLANLCSTRRVDLEGGLLPANFQDCTEREIQAVDSEHKKNIQSDMWASLPKTLTSHEELMTSDSSNSRSTCPSPTTRTTSLELETTRHYGPSLKRRDVILDSS
jgi:hypothetical protein